MIRDFVGDGHWLILQGFIAVIFGLATLVWPGVTLWILVLLWGVFAMIDGLFAIGAVVIGNMERNRGWWALRGITGIAIGIITLLWPSITAIALLVLIALWALVTGLVELSIAVLLRRQLVHEWVLGTVGILSIALGLILLANPKVGALAITWAIGWYATVFGLMLLWLGWKVGRETRSPGVRTR